jgi:glycosyltransferase involved in cell wall biosynthesis
VSWIDAAHHTGRKDWFFTAELFSERERSGFGAFLDNHACRTAALFHDAIPLKFPQTTWPHSVARHPEYMKRLARFDRVFAVSDASRRELSGYWRWLGLTSPPPIEVLPLGADFAGQPRVTGEAESAEGTGAAVRLLCVGIVEPRKNQAFLLEVAERLWSSGATFELHFVGRTNPHFGEPIARRINAAAKRHRGHLFWHQRVDDKKLAELYRSARLTAFPTIAEGCGLPLLESLWMGVPCMCSDLPVLRENADGGGCAAVAVNDVEAWTVALRRIVSDDEHVSQLRVAATTRPLPTWADCAATLRHTLQR